MKENFFFFLLPSVVAGIFGFFVVVPFTTYYLNPADFGIYALLTALTMPIGPLSTTGVSWVLGGNFFKIDDQQRRILLFNVALADAVLKSFWVILFWFLAPCLLPLCLREVGSDYVSWFRLSLVTVLLNAFWPTVSYHLILSKNGSCHALFEILPWLVSAVVSVFTLSFLGWKTETLFWSPIAGGIVLFLLNLWHLRSHVIFQVNSSWLKEIFLLGFPCIPANLVEMLRNSLDRIFLGKWLDLNMVGVYSHSLAYRNVFSMITKAFSRVFTPHAIEVYSSNQNHSALDSRLNLWYVLIGTLGIPIMFFANEVIAALTHGKFTSAAVLVKIWYLLVLCFSYAIPYNAFLQETRRAGTLATTDILVNIFFLILSIPVIYYFGPVGAVLNYVCGNYMLQLIRHHVSVKHGCRSFSQRGLWSAIVFLSLGVIIADNFNVTIWVKGLFTILFVASNLWLNKVSMKNIYI